MNDAEWMQAAIELSRKCPPGTTFSVGAVLVDARGQLLATGFSRETDATVHAEECALAKFATGADLHDATMYTTLEPCSTRLSGRTSCTELILDRGIGRVVYALDEPPMFVDCVGAETLRVAGVEVVRLDEFALIVGGLVQPGRDNGRP